MGANGVDLVDKVLNVVNAELSKRFSDNGIVRERNSLSVDLAVPSLEDEFSDGFSGRIAEGDVGLHFSEEVG